MFLSKETIEVLENFASICPQAVINEEDSESIMIQNQSQSIFAFYDLPEDEKKIQTFGIYDLQRFTQIIKLMGEIKDVKFHNEYLEIFSKTSGIKYYYASLDLMPERPKKKSDKEDYEIVFELTSSRMQKYIEMANIMQNEYVSFKTKDGKIMAIISDLTTSSSDEFKEIIGKNEGLKKDIEDIAVLSVEDFKMSKNFDWIISIYPNYYVKFSAKKEKSEIGLEYYISPIKINEIER